MCETFGEVVNESGCIVPVTEGEGWKRINFDELSVLGDSSAKVTESLSTDDWSEMESLCRK